MPDLLYFYTLFWILSYIAFLMCIAYIPLYLINAYNKRRSNIYKIAIIIATVMSVLFLLYIIWVYHKEDHFMNIWTFFTTGQTRSGRDAWARAQWAEREAARAERAENARRIEQDQRAWAATTIEAAARGHLAAPAHPAKFQRRGARFRCDKP